MKRVSTKGLCATAVATFLCTACHADGLTKQQVKELLEENNQILANAMKENTEALAKVQWTMASLSPPFQTVMRPLAKT
jgi:hypothetical protein